MTTYIKRVPQFKAVQYKMEDKVLAELFELVPNLTTWKINDSGLTLTHTVIKLGEDTREETLRLRDGDFNDWLVRTEKGDLSVLSDKDFKAQYEAAPEAKATGDVKIDVDGKVSGFGIGSYSVEIGQIAPVKIVTRYTMAGAFMRPGETVDEANQRMNHEMQKAAVSQVAGSKTNGWGCL